MESEKLIEKVGNCILKHRMIKPSDAVLVGVSGGADSIALVHILLRLFSKSGFRLGIAHFNHCLRGSESDRDARFVSSVGKTLNLPFYFKEMDIKRFSSDQKLSLEEAGRNARYRFLEKTASTHNYNKIALGHHQDDLAETVLMNILRGSGPRGLCGIPPKRGIIVRPLIGVRKCEIQKFLQKEGIIHVSDSSNKDLSFLRNQIRLELIPLLASRYNQEIVEVLSRMAGILRDEQEWIESMVNQLFKSVIIYKNVSGLALSIPELNKMPTAAARRIIRNAIREVKGNLHGIKFVHLNTILELIMPDTIKPKQVHLPGPVKMFREKDRLVFVRCKTCGRFSGNQTAGILEPTGFIYKVVQPGNLYIREIDTWLELSVLSDKQIKELKESNFETVSSHEAYMDMTNFCFPLTVRSWQPGDRFSPLGVEGSQKVKKFLINHKVPLSEKKNVIVLECNGKILWLAGFRIDNLVKVSSASQKVIKAKLLKGSPLQN